eukprot:TRINITY_DN22584_c0_g1_i1.p1 TRINITY_DN22584_c0_g1~~TRINITY_DN22584_c0_g1_i1.p1  ORF type:complete len:151 (-),score=28.44 TRINITY_DN22584_c0_g1_i1:164-616(-)
MADLCGDYEGFANVTELSCSGDGDIGRFATATPHMLTDSGSFKEDGKGSRWQMLIWRSLEMGEFLNLLHGSVPLKVGLNRLENEVGVGNVVRSESCFAGGSSLICEVMWCCCLLLALGFCWLGLLLAFQLQVLCFSWGRALFCSGVLSDQ